MILIAIVPRAAFVAFAGDSALQLDEIEYDRIAWNLSEGKGFSWFFDLPCTFRAPLYPSLLGLIYSVFGADYLYGRYLGVVLGVVSVVLTARLAQVVFNAKVGLIAGGIVALYPPLVLYSYTLMSESLYIVLLLTTLILLLSWHKTKQRSRLVLSAIVFGLVVLTRPSFFLFFVMVVLWIVFFQSRRRTLNESKSNDKAALKNSAIFVAISFLIIVPWCVRNYIVTNQIMFVDSRPGFNLHVGFNKESTGRFHVQSALDLVNRYVYHLSDHLKPGLTEFESRGFFLRDAKSYVTRDLNPLNLSKVERKELAPLFATAPPDRLLHIWGKQSALKYIRENPWRSLAQLPKKFAYFWGLEHRLYIYAYSQNIFGKIKMPFLAFGFLLLVLPFPFIFVSGVLDFIRQPIFATDRMLLLLPGVYLSAVHTVVFGDARFHFVLIPIVSMFCANFWCSRGMHANAGALVFS